MAQTRHTHDKQQVGRQVAAPRSRGSFTRHWSRGQTVGALLLMVVGPWAVKLVRLGRTVGTYGSYWSESKGVPGGLVYVALGDSAAQGIGASRPSRGYVGLLADRMREQTGREVLVVNLSASGATVRDVVDKQLVQLQALRPDIVSVAVGGNDVPFYDGSRFTSAVKELTAALPTGTYIADVPYYMHGHWERDALAAGRGLTASARDYGLHVVSLHDAARDRGVKAMLTDYAADWFHPNDRGHRVWADAFWNELQHSPALVARSTPGR